MVQSVGGGGGSGGFSVSGAIERHDGALAASFGSAAGGPGSSSAGNVALINEGTAVTTTGQRSDGILIHSVGGGGGSGGFSVSGTMSGSPTLGLSLGGSGAGGGNGSGSVTLTNTGGISTQGDDSHGILASKVWAEAAARAVLASPRPFPRAERCRFEHWRQRIKRRIRGLHFRGQHRHHHHRG